MKMGRLLHSPLPRRGLLSVWRVNRKVEINVCEKLCLASEGLFVYSAGIGNLFSIEMNKNRFSTGPFCFVSLCTQCPYVFFFKQAVSPL